ncbi:MAG: 4-hydroxy-tetrahydrodipicolinate synthase [Oscillospiraceae bacterium]
MREPVFTGTCTALVTPFDKNGAVAYDTLAQQIEFQLTNGIDALCICGTTGEASTLSLEEQMAVIAFCVKQVKGRVKVLAGVGSNCTASAVERSKRAADCGADALLHVTPYYNKATQSGLIAHYEAVSNATPLPVLLYNVPGRTGLSFTAETYQVLAQIPNINGVKEASGNLVLFAHTKALCPADFSVWSGNDDQVVPLMSLGALGVISVAANVIPAKMVKLTHLCLAGDFEAAARLQLRYLPLIDALFCEVNPIPVKSALQILGRDSGTLRLPLCEPSAQHFVALQKALADISLLQQQL